MSHPPSISLRFAVVLSLSFAASYPTNSLPFFKPQASSSSSSSCSPHPLKRATTSDLLALLGTPKQAAAINPEEARQLRSCFKFLVPFTPSDSHHAPPSQFDLVPHHSVSRRFLRPRSRSSRECCRREEENQLVWWPPESVMELARLVFDSGGNPEAIHLALDPFVKPVPDVEGSKEDLCELTRTPYCSTFINEELNLYLGFLFELIAARGPSVGLNTSLTRYDLFHGHLFIAKDSGRLGILFHAKEYPACDKDVFPYNLGFCQIGSDVTYDDQMNFRNILWLAPLPSSSYQAWSAPGVLVVLDSHPKGIIYRDLIPEYANVARTLYEDDFGHPVVDVNYLNVGGDVPRYEIFVC